MATIKTKNNKVVLKNGKASCDCCCVCEAVSQSYGSSSSPGNLTVKVLGPATVQVTASNVDGLTMGWSMTTSATFTNNNGPSYSFPSTTVSVSQCLNSGCQPTQDKKTVNIPSGVCGILDFSFSLSGYDCCDQFDFSFSCT